jgi:hypothetical protein
MVNYLPNLNLQLSKLCLPTQYTYDVLRFWTLFVVLF